MTIQVGGASLAWESFGEGRPMLCLHGLAVDRRMMIGCMEPLFAGRQRGWRRIYVDLPGMGETRAPLEAASSDRLLEILLAFIDAVIPGTTFAVAGESYGGYLARGIVHKRPRSIDGVMLLCPMALPDRSARDKPAFSVVARDEEFCATIPHKGKRKFEADMVVQTRATWERYAREILPGLAAGDRGFQEVLHGPAYAFGFEVDSLLPPCTAPALLLLGRQDHVVGYRDAARLVENFPRAAVAILDRAGHNLQIEQQRLFEALAAEWLDRMEEKLP
jgi:pimeloyl-ACP methyl ester carboxylesterase